jgi:hypothetical protein
VSRASVNLIAFLVVMVVIPWSLIWLMRTAGRRWGTGIQDLESRPPPSERPLHCRLNLFHNWRTVHPPGEARYQRCLDCGKTREISSVRPLP